MLSSVSCCMLSYHTIPSRMVSYRRGLLPPSWLAIRNACHNLEHRIAKAHCKSSTPVSQSLDTSPSFLCSVRVHVKQRLKRGTRVMVQAMKDRAHDTQQDRAHDTQQDMHSCHTTRQALTYTSACSWLVIAKKGAKHP